MYQLKLAIHHDEHDARIQRIIQDSHNIYRGLWTLDQSSFIMLNWPRLSVHRKLAFGASNTEPIIVIRRP
jgi:hypothetical protein